jgi:ribonuclease III
MKSEILSKLESLLGHKFSNRDYLMEALRHSSFVNEQPQKELRDNERLEFLGDAVLSLVVSHLLMESYPEFNEGNLSRTRAKLVNEAQLAGMARSMELGSHLQLGRGEVQTGGSDKNSILADAFEALVAAIYLDGGFECVSKFIRHQFNPLLEVSSRIMTRSNHDFKSRLQEFVQGGHHEVPRYEVIHESGPDHDKTFRIRMVVCGIETVGEGKSKKTAEQNAARKGLEIIQESL